MKINGRKQHLHLTAVWQNGGFGAFLGAKVLKQSSGIFSNFGSKKPPLRQAAGTLCEIFRKIAFQEKLVLNTHILLLLLLWK